jgi:hypothetical protein
LERKFNNGLIAGSDCSGIVSIIVCSSFLKTAVVIVCLPCSSCYILAHGDQDA